MVIVMRQALREGRSNREERNDFFLRPYEQRRLELAEGEEEDLCALKKNSYQLFLRIEKVKR